MCWWELENYVYLTLSQQRDLFPGKWIISSCLYRCYLTVRYQWKADNYGDNVSDFPRFSSSKYQIQEQATFPTKCSSCYDLFSLPACWLPIFLSTHSSLLAWVSVRLHLAKTWSISLSLSQFVASAVLWPLQFLYFCLTYLLNPGFREHRFLYTSTVVLPYRVHRTYPRCFLDMHLKIMGCMFRQPEMESQLILKSDVTPLPVDNTCWWSLAMIASVFTQRKKLKQKESTSLLLNGSISPFHTPTVAPPLLRAPLYLGHVQLQHLLHTSYNWFLSCLIMQTLLTGLS